MAIEFDRAKDRANRQKHGLSLSEAEDLDLDRALVAEDLTARGEARFIAIGPVGPRVCVLVYAERGDNVRAISLRPATKAEVRLWRSEV